jgi:hypothetical protein
MFLDSDDAIHREFLDVLIPADGKIFRSPGCRDEFLAVLSDSLFEGLLRHKFIMRLPVRKWLFLKLISLRNFTLTAVVIKFVRLLRLA